MVRNKVIFAVLSFFLSRCLLAQSIVDQVLRQAANDTRLSALEQQLSYYKSNSFKSPALRELELRIRGNNFDSSPDNYALRFGILNPKERVANNLFDIAKKGYLLKTKKYLLNEILSEKYRGLINNYDLVTTLSLLVEEKRQIKAFELAQKGVLAFNDWIKLDQTLLELELKQADFESLIHTKNNELLINDSLFLNLDWHKFKLISLDEVKNTIALHSTKSFFLEVDLATEKLRLDQLKLDIDYAKSWNIGFLQAGYDTKGGDPLKNQMDYRIGITIPLFNEDKPKLRREELNLMGTASELKRLEEVNALIDLQRMKEFNDLVLRYEMLKLKEKELSNLAALGVDGIDGFLALSKYIISVKKSLHKTYVSTLLLYIEILEKKGILGAEPYLNYLSKELNSFIFN
ncbi:MAG: hypothetical protein CMB82_07830 [Flammeovirgaceae bacterium]|nr:hypothetical protein [Flammeovirgaceae bacterium]